MRCDVIKTENMFKKALLPALAVVIAAQLNLSPMSTDFRISTAAICLSVFAWFGSMIPIRCLVAASATGIFITRVIWDFVTGGLMYEAVISAYPEAVFYMIYGCGLLLFRKIFREPYKLQIYMVYVALLDYFSNVAELMIRIQMSEFQLRIQTSIIFVAFVRVIILGFILSILSKYRLVLLKRSNAERYHRLLLLISQLHGEIIWMEKSTALVERTMNRSYDLYYRLQELYDEKSAEEALNIAKDIHEVKKEYKLIVRGLSDAMENERNQDSMNMEELITEIGRAHV